MSTKNSHSAADGDDLDATSSAAGSKESLVENPDDDTGGTTSNISEPAGSLSEEAFETLLACFSPDRDEAANLYVKKLTKLTRFFEWNRSRQPETNAQETLDRTARRIHGGVTISNLDGFINGVAYKILKEEWRWETRAQEVSKALPTTTPEPQLDDDESELRKRCLDTCLEELPPETRALLQDYFREDKGAKIELRRQLADKLGIGPNALRIRVHRLIKGLKQCMDKCLGRDPDGSK